MFTALCSDKKKTKSKKNGVTFYAFHISLLSMKKKRTKEMMNKGLKTVVILRTKLFRLNNARVPVLHDNLDRIEKIKHIYFEIERIMEPKAEVSSSAVR